MKAATDRKSVDSDWRIDILSQTLSTVSNQLTQFGSLSASLVRLLFVKVLSFRRLLIGYPKSVPPLSECERRGRNLLSSPVYHVISMSLFFRRPTQSFVNLWIDFTRSLAPLTLYSCTPPSSLLQIPILVLWTSNHSRSRHISRFSFRDSHRKTLFKMRTEINSTPGLAVVSHAMQLVISESSQKKTTLNVCESRRVTIIHCGSSLSNRSVFQCFFGDYLVSYFASKDAVRQYVAKWHKWWHLLWSAYTAPPVGRTLSTIG